MSILRFASNDDVVSVQVHCTDGPDLDYEDLTWKQTVELTNQLPDDPDVRKYVIIDSDGRVLDEWCR